MTAAQLLDALGGLGVTVAVCDGRPELRSAFGGKLPEAVRAKLAELMPHVRRHRDDLLALCGVDVFDAAAAVRRMNRADAVVAAAGGVGLHPEIQLAAEVVCERYAARDRAGVAEWCEQVERLARLYRKREPQ